MLTKILKLIFYTKLLFLAKNVQILNIREYLIGSLIVEQTAFLIIYIYIFR